MTKLSISKEEYEETLIKAVTLLSNQSNNFELLRMQIQTLENIFTDHVGLNKVKRNKIYITTTNPEITNHIELLEQISDKMSNNIQISKRKIVKIVNLMEKIKS